MNFRFRVRADESPYAFILLIVQKKHAGKMFILISNLDFGTIFL